MQKVQDSYIELEQAEVIDKIQLSEKQKVKFNSPKTHCKRTIAKSNV